MPAEQPTAIRAPVLQDGSRRLSAAWSDFRNRILTKPGFQRWAARFPLTRSIARRRARALFDIPTGFVYSQVLLACVRLNLFQLLARGARPLEELAVAMNLPVDGARRLLLAARSLDLVEARGDDRYALGDLGAVMAASPGIAAMVEHNALLYADLRDPVALLRGECDTKLSSYWAYVDNPRPEGLNGGDVESYSELMAASQEMMASDILDAYPLGRHRRMLDLAGGAGIFAMAAARRWPGLQATVIDLPAVAAVAAEGIRRAGMADRVRATGVDLFGERPLPNGHDIASLVRVLHDHDDDRAMRILERAREALGEGGTLLIAEPMSETSGAEPVGDAYFGLYLLAMGSGRPRTVAELKDFVRRAGFRRVREVATPRPILVRALVATA